MSLPAEMWWLIFAPLEIPILRSLRLVCSYWCQILDRFLGPQPTPLNQVVGARFLQQRGYERLILHHTGPGNNLPPVHTLHWYGGNPPPDTVSCRKLVMHNHLKIWPQGCRKILLRKSDINPQKIPSDLNYHSVTFYKCIFWATHYTFQGMQKLTLTFGSFNIGSAFQLHNIPEVHLLLSPVDHCYTSRLDARNCGTLFFGREVIFRNLEHLELGMGNTWIIKHFSAEHSYLVSDYRFCSEESSRRTSNLWTDKLAIASRVSCENLYLAPVLQEEKTKYLVVNETIKNVYHCGSVQPAQFPGATLHLLAEDPFPEMWPERY